jgi:hypothetical protein
MWRSRVACPDRFSAQTSEFLDKHHLQGKITKTGTFILKNPVGELVPYELLPLRVKKAVNLMPLSRDKIKKMSAFKSSLVNLFIYGYMPDVNQAIVVREQYWREFRRKWQLDHPEAMKKHAKTQSETQFVWSKNQEDVHLHIQAVSQGSSSSSC